MGTNIGLSRADFKQFRPDKRIQGRLFTLLVKKNEEGASRAACVVSKRVAARAVVRNKIKRLCREALRHAHRSLSIPYTLVFYAKAGASGVTFRDVEKDVDELLRKLDR